MFRPSQHHVGLSVRAFLKIFGLAFIALAIAMGGALGCERADSKQDNPEKPSRTLMVFAASSLTEAFGDIAENFEREHPNVEVALHFAGSQTLRTQIENGAPADVFAAAHPKYMPGPADAFAQNELMIVTPADNPAGIDSLRDLPKAERLVVGSGQVPIGRYTREFLKRAEQKFGSDFRRAVERDIVSREVNVRLVLAKVAMGEADAGIVYRTDAASRGDQVRTVPIPTNLTPRAIYPIAVLARSAHPELAEQWVSYVLSEKGQRILGNRGFSSLKPD